MAKSIIQKNVVQLVEDSEDDQDDDSKYLKDDFDFGNDVLKQERKLLKIHNLATTLHNDKKNALKLKKWYDLLIELFLYFICKNISHTLQIICFKVFITELEADIIKQ